MEVTNSTLSLSKVNVPRNLDNRPLMTDFEFFYNYNQYFDSWKDLHYPLSTLPELLGSGDIEVWPSYWFASNHSINCLKSIVVETGETRFHKRGGQWNSTRQTYTLSAGYYNIRVEAYETKNCSTTANPIFVEQKGFEVQFCSYELWKLKIF